MDYTQLSSPSHKGNNNIISPNHHHHHHHHHHNQELEWMRMMMPSSSSTRIGVCDQEHEGGAKQQQHVQYNPTSVGSGEGEIYTALQKEHMFDKVVTPSDVGKLNRLVIPKQHAEKYFPLDSSSNEKGLLLNFEDRTGKPWRFRYSYWNSSQSYVMTKGWSRFVKEKKLDAGDVVSFQRGVGDGKDKFFIDWRRRLNNTLHGRVIPGTVWGASSNLSPGFVLQSHPHPYPHPYSPLGLLSRPSGVWDQESVNRVPSSHQPNLYNPIHRGYGSSLGNGSSSVGGFGFGFGNIVNNPYPVTGSLILVRSSGLTHHPGVCTSSLVQGNWGSHRLLEEDNHNRNSNRNHDDDQGSESTVVMQEGMVYEPMPVAQGKVSAKRLRLFGVNMECPIINQTHDFDILSSSLATASTHHDQQQLRSSSSFVPLEKGKSSTSSNISLNLDI